MTSVFMSMATRSRDRKILSLKLRFEQRTTPLPKLVAEMAWKTQMHLPHHIPHPSPQLGHQHLTGLRLGIV